MSAGTIEPGTTPKAGRSTRGLVRRTVSGSDNRFVRMLPVLSPIGLLVLWEIASRVGILDDRFFPAPTAIVAQVGPLLESGELLSNTWISVQRLLIGFVIGAVPGLLLGLAMGLYRYLRLIVEPLVAATYPVPKSAIFPLFLLIFGLGEASKVAVVAVGVFFPVVINTAAGVLAIDKVYRDVGRNFRASSVKTFRTVALPGALPLIMTGVKLAIGMALMLIVAAEMLGGDSGLGYLIWNSWQTFSVETMYIALIVISVLGVVFNLIVNEVERWLVPWRRS
ncbi:ABC transporter permease [Pseudonocardia sp. RS010]|uniref:ABC transporter permease n=1 Tax=Pseudonocardia sp. RS010 TaxID=3385979 RepID=UPI0039A076B1